MTRKLPQNLKVEPHEPVLTNVWPPLLQGCVTVSLPEFDILRELSSPKQLS